MGVELRVASIRLCSAPFSLLSSRSCSSASYLQLACSSLAPPTLGSSWLGPNTEQSNFSVAQVLLLWSPLLESNHAWGKELPSSKETQSRVPPHFLYLPDLETSVLPSPVITAAVPGHGSAERSVHWGPGKIAGPVSPTEHS